ncbi:MAG: hypothetical protein C4313_02505 [Thermoflexus sp.]|uniref:TVP38/TMEM64 family protein n=1 Tax=Thermoflexus sp. TaxID=1969742 RepID=UPI0033201031
MGRLLREHGLRAAGLGALLIGGLLTFPYLWPLVSQRERLEAWLAAHAAGGALALVFLNALQVVIAPLPGALLGWVAGYWFGPLWGSLLTWLGVNLGNGLAMVLARGLGRPLLLALLPRERLARAEAVIRRHGLTALWILYLLPFTSSDLLAWAVGLSPLPLGPAFAVSALARLAHVLIANAIGVYLRSGDLRWLGIAGVLSLGASALALWIATRRRIPLRELASK